MSVLDWVNSALNLVGAGLNFGSSLYDTKTNKAIADQNLAFQQQQFQYQQNLNKLQMEREDTAYQRSVSDMQAAGLSPLNASPASANALNAGTAPQNTYQSNISDGVNNAMNTLTNLMNLSIAKKQSEAQIQKTDSETALNLQTLKQLDSTNPITRDILNAQLSGLLADNLSKNNQNEIFDTITKPSLRFDSMRKQLDYARAYNDFSYQQFYGLSDSMSPAERVAAFKRHKKIGDGSTPYDRLFPKFVELKNGQFGYDGIFKDYGNIQDNEFVANVLDKDLLSMWALITGTLTGVGGLGK